ncbi:hypothetical protein [Streptomyces sp. 35G-GA-8]|uniref:hypothetical protein n=1 Tax=Streptomyces sp. 35G-GA-8 TaxID=2939434 RepID=UPI00201F9259|nr:hypothetical protein [Streptomyces sp. 35G-GA-8]MCL7377051.1 hypothetical protein [Streptomyces sp. 35G-GA-8]
MSWLRSRTSSRHHARTSPPYQHLAGIAELGREKAHALGRRRAEQNVPASAVPDAIRTGLRFVWEDFTAPMAPSGEAAVLARLSQADA